MVRIIAWRVPPYDNGCYLIADPRNEAVVIDPSMGERQVIDTVREKGLRLVEILNTHGHPDHIFGNAAVKEATRARLAIHRLDEYRLGPKRPPTQLEAPPSSADDLFDDGQLSFLDDVELSALHTPGHTEGSTCFYLRREGALFSGDLLFKGNIGRTDLPGSDPVAMAESLSRITSSLPAKTRVYPGHGDETTLGAEIATLRGLRDLGMLPGLQLA
ncbi:MAG TPA: MBL fold metallo-hydrolase [Candidatus Limnocylindria bacterium]|nr:MBL fold metallo-hydrolase [Candidatus Limnocylindria bacterium]